jgi:hypothetical protein
MKSTLVAGRWMAISSATCGPFMIGMITSVTMMWIGPW